MASQIQEMIKSNGNPMELFKQVTKSYTPDKMNSFINQARQMGFSEDLLKQVSTQ